MYSHGNVLFSTLRLHSYHKIQFYICSQAQLYSCTVLHLLSNTVVQLNMLKASHCCPLKNGPGKRKYSTRTVTARGGEGASTGLEMFSIGPALRPGRFIVLTCLSVCRNAYLFVCPHIFFEASHWLSDHKTRSRPLIGSQKSQMSS